MLITENVFSIGILRAFKETFLLYSAKQSYINWLGCEKVWKQINF